MPTMKEIEAWLAACPESADSDAEREASQARLASAALQAALTDYLAARKEVEEAQRRWQDARLAMRELMVRPNA